MFQDSYAYLVQVLQVAIEDRYKVIVGDVFSYNHSQFMDGERQRPSYPPLQVSKTEVRKRLTKVAYKGTKKWQLYLHVRGKGLIQVLQAGPEAFA